MASIKKLIRTEWRVTCRGLPQHNTTFKSTSAAKRYAYGLEAQGMTVQITKSQIACWLARVRRVGQRDISKTFDKNEDAKNWVSETEGKMVTGMYTDVRKAGRVTLGEVLLKFDTEKRAHLPTSDPERCRIRKICKHAIAKVRLNSLTPKHFADYRDERLKLVKGTTVTRELAILSSVINLEILEQGLALPFNPASGHRVARPASEPGDIRDRRFKELHSASPKPLSPTKTRKTHPVAKVVGALTELSVNGIKDPFGSDAVDISAPWVIDPQLVEWMQFPQTEEQLLMRACRYPRWFRPRKAVVSESTLRDRAWRQRTCQPVKARNRRNGRFWALVSFAIQTAMRRGELLKLEWRHVYLKEGYLDLPGKITKNRKPRIVPLSLRAIRILQTQAQTSDFVFPFKVDMVKESYKRARARADAIDLRLHDLRHEATSRLFERTTLRETEIGGVTGHTDARMLQRYYNKRTSEFIQRFRASFIG